MQIAAGFGLDTCDLNNEADPQAALQAIIRRPGPALIHVRIDAEEKSVSDGAAGRGKYRDGGGISHAETIT